MIILRDKFFASRQETYRHFKFAREWIAENPNGTKEEFLREVARRKLRNEHLYLAAFIRVKSEGSIRCYSLLGDFRNKVGDKLLDKAINLDKEIAKLHREVDRIRIKNIGLEDKLREFAKTLGIKIIDVEYSPKGSGQYDKEIRLVNHDVLALAHELGHYTNRTGNWFEKHISEKNSKNIETYTKGAERIYNTIKIPRKSTLPMLQHADKYGAKENVSKLASFGKSGVYKVAEEINATRNGLSILKQLGATTEILESYTKKFKLSRQTYTKTVKKNNLLLLSELIRPEHLKVVL